MATYMVWEGYIEKLNKKMATAAKKCAKYGIDFKYELTGRDEYRTVRDSEGEKHRVRYVEVIAEGKAQMNGWEWLASVERTENGNLIHSAKDIEIPNKYYTSGSYCEHCGKNIWRKHLFLVKNVETGDIKQVGRGCLRDYTNGMDAEGMAWWGSLLTGLEEEEGREPDFGCSGFWKMDYLNVNEVTRYVSETIRRFGFVPKGVENKVSTATRAYDFLNFAYGKIRSKKIRDAIEADMKSVNFNADSPEAHEEAEKALAWIASADDSRSSYIHNLKVVCSADECSSFHYWILASLIPAWNKDLVREAERKAKEEERKASEYVGEIGKRITFNVASTKIVTSWETDYGTMWLVEFMGADGNVFMWKASSLNPLPDDFSEIKKVTGTVKEHKEYAGIKQTFVNRCKVA